MVSIVIPSRNEPYLKETISDLLVNSKGSIEIIAVLDGWWPKPDDIVSNDNVHYLHLEQPKGMRNAINQGVAIAKGDYILKCDAHCAFSEGYDKQLVKDHQTNWVQVPRRYALDVKKWAIEERKDNKYPIDYMYLSKDLQGVPWHEKNRDKSLESKKIDDLMSAQGSCWFMTKEYYNYLELLDEKTYGTFWQEFQEIGLKCWLSGGQVKVNKNLWYAHWHKTKGRGYSLPEGEQEKTRKMIEKWTGKIFWHKQTASFEWLVDRFNPPK